MLVREKQQWRRSAWNWKIPPSFVLESLPISYDADVQYVVDQNISVPNLPSMCKIHQS